MHHAHTYAAIHARSLSALTRMHRSRRACFPNLSRAFRSARSADSLDVIVPLRCRVAEATVVESSSSLIYDKVSEDLLTAWAPCHGESPPRELIDVVAVRTRAMDAWLETPSWPPVRTTKRQIVILGAATDTRAFRLGLGQHTTIFEIDEGKLLERKREALSERQRQRTKSVHVHANPHDVHACSQALVDAGLDARIPTRWVFEGPLLDLESAPPPEALFALAQTCASSPASGIGAAILDPGWALTVAGLISCGAGSEQQSSDARCLSRINPTLDLARKSGWREHRTLRRDDLVSLYKRDLPDAFALMFADADPDP